MNWGTAHLRLSILIFCVVSFHLFLFFFNFSKREQGCIKKRLITNTYYLRPPPSPIKPQVKPPQVKLKDTHSPRPTPPSSKPQVKPKLKNFTPNKKSPPLSQKQKTLQELREALSKIKHKQNQISKLPLTLPQSINTLQIDLSEEEGEYSAALVSSLKKKLELPEEGRVKLELILFNSGKMRKVNVLQAESEKNRNYLEQQLRSLTFPPFTKELKKKKEHSFILLFCNEK